MRRLLVMATAMAMVLALAPTAAAGGKGAVQIGGGGFVIGDPADGPGFDCLNQGVFTLKLDSGSLRGCWYTDEIYEDSIQENPSGTYQERGAETFVGEYWVDGKKIGEGSFSTTYHFTGKFDGDGNEIFGRCQHPIVEGTGTGIFAGVKGRVDFKDVDVVNGILEYRGHI